MLFLFFFWRNRTFQASVTHALMAFSLAIGMGLISEYSVTLAQLSLLNSSLYFIVDLTTRLDWGKCLHHLISLSSCLIALNLNPEIQTFVAKILGVIELANPYWAALRLRLEKSNEIPLPEVCTKTLSGTLFMITFFLTRFVWFPYFLLTEAPLGLPWTVFWVIFLPFMLLNSYWLYLLVKGFCKEMKIIYNHLRRFSLDSQCQSCP